MSALNSFFASALKVVFSLLAAFVATVVCFYLMYMLINVGHEAVSSETVTISAALKLDQSALQSRQVRKKPERSLPMEPPAGPDLVSELRDQAIAAGKSMLLQSPAENMDPEAASIAFKPPVKDLVAVKVVRPVYPLYAVKHQIEGHVVVQFTLREDGSVLNPFVVESEPTDIFDLAALKAIRQFRFEPPEIEDQFVIASGILRFAFELKSTHSN